ncbi:MAG: gliding motility lipoprotein GldD [Bacteroidales bacterium]|nr:gliding motility lipoprotein GldD [Bacteroidales bacterium]
MKIKPMLLLALLMLYSCRQNYTPKPAGYLRIDYPEKNYSMFRGAGPYEFKYPVYAKVLPNTAENSEPYWYDVYFPGFDGTIHLSYKRINNNLSEYIADTRTLVYKHTSRADGIVEIQFLDTADKRYGIIYDLQGEVASPVQFFVTDSTEHFLRGSLYFNTTPNRDSLDPVIDFVRKDIEYMVESVKWK